MTYSQITQEIYPAFMQLIQAQNAGLVRLPEKASYAFGKTFTEVAKYAKIHAKLKNLLLKEHALTDDYGNFKTVKVGNSNEYEFKDGQKAIFIEDVNELNQVEVECKIYPVSREILEAVTNFPIQLYPVLEEYGMITELHLEKPKLQLAN